MRKRELMQDVPMALTLGASIRVVSRYQHECSQPTKGIEVRALRMRRDHNAGLRRVKRTGSRGLDIRAAASTDDADTCAKARAGAWPETNADTCTKAGAGTWAETHADTCTKARAGASPETHADTCSKPNAGASAETDSDACPKARTGARSSTDADARAISSSAAA